MRSVLAGWWCLLVLAAGVLTPTFVAAQERALDMVHEDPVRSSAREAFARGVAAAREGRWDDARLEFARSYELVPSAVTLLNLAGSQINSGKLVAGYENYRRILLEPADAASHRERVEHVVLELQARIPRVRIVLTQGGADPLVVLDGQALAQAERDEHVLLDPGSHRVEVRRPGQAAVEREFELGEGQEIVVNLDEVCALCEAGRVALEDRGMSLLNPRTASAPAGTVRKSPQVLPSERRHPWRVAPWLAFGAGAAGAVLLSVTGPMALRADRSLARGCGLDNHCSSGDVARADRLALAADIGLGVAVSGVAVGTIVLWVQRRAERRVKVAPTASRTGAGFVSQVWF